MGVLESHLSGALRTGGCSMAACGGALSSGRVGLEPCISEEEALSMTGCNCCFSGVCGLLSANHVEDTAGLCASEGEALCTGCCDGSSSVCGSGEG